MPKVSIGLPVWNGEKYLPAALDGILSQDFTDFELLISDNASTDTTAEIATSYAARDPRIRYIRQPRNLGAAGNFNDVFHQTTGPYFRWAAYDDVIAPGYLSACVTALDAQPDAVLAFPQTMAIDSEGRALGIYDAVTRTQGQGPTGRLDDLIGPGDHSQSYLHMCFPVFGLIRRIALQDTSLIANMPRSDKLLLVELALKGAFAEVPEPLFLRREHAAGSVISAEGAANAAELERRLAHWFDPQKGNFFPATTTRLGWGYLRAVLRTPMRAGQKWGCTKTLLGWARQHFRIIGGEIKIVLRERLSAWRYRIFGQPAGQQKQR
ncbi:glycosyltransferase family 2 protein [Loktanella agnita]|uniref:glycosyltransferase family 2 protein n=1 Tax=Loktanella agnita TaxID=287097 RepID=UPI003985DE21